MDWRHLEGFLEGFEDRLSRIGPLDFDPDFQRGHVWTMEQRVAYIEYKIRGGFGQDIVSINCPGYTGTRIPLDSDVPGPQVVDGVQRLTTVRMFLRDEFRVFGHFASELGRPPSRLEFVIKTNNLCYRREVITWYLALNARGTPHTKEEIARVERLLGEVSSHPG